MHSNRIADESRSVVRLQVLVVAAACIAGITLAQGRFGVRKSGVSSSIRFAAHIPPTSHVSVLHVRVHALPTIIAILLSAFLNSQNEGEILFSDGVPSHARSTSVLAGVNGVHLPIGLVTAQFVQWTVASTLYIYKLYSWPLTLWGRALPLLPSLLIDYAFGLQLNIADPNTGAQKVIEVDDEKKLLAFYEKRMAQEVEGDVLGDEFKGYVFRLVDGRKLFVNKSEGS